MTPELTRTGKTSVIQKIVGPSWRPTEAMLKRDPKLPEYVGPGVDNPLGTHAYISVGLAIEYTEQMIPEKLADRVLQGV